MKWWLMAAGGVLAAGLVGCGDKAGPAPGGGEKPAAGRGQADPPSAPKDAPVELVEVHTFAALDAAIKEQQGKVVLVDFWATF